MKKINELKKLASAEFKAGNIANALKYFQQIDRINGAMPDLKLPDATLKAEKEGIERIATISPRPISNLQKKNFFIDAHQRSKVALDNDIKGANDVNNPSNHSKIAPGS